MPHSESQPLPTADGYEIGDEIGRGGMGVVHRGRDLALDREVAIKLLQDRFPADGPDGRRFIAEARITGQLQHPGIPAVHHVGTLPDGRPFLAMKLVEGRTLDALLTERGPDAADFLAVFEKVCQAVGYAHAHGVIHRDLKPANVMVGSFGEVLVMDWGLAKVLASREGGRPEDEPEAARTRDTETNSWRGADNATQAGSVLGTPGYMSPEQARGETDGIDARTDVFALGAILCVILTGRPPYEGSTKSVRRKSAAADLMTAFGALVGRKSEAEWVSLCLGCLSADKADRPVDANAVAAAAAGLRVAADDRVKRAETAKAADAARWRTYKRAAVVVGLVMTTGLAGTAWGLVRANAVTRSEFAQRRVAEENEAEAKVVLQFLREDVIAVARPKGQDGGRGKDISVREAIAASLPALESKFRDRPLAEARLRFELGTTLLDLAEPAAASDQLNRARELFTRQLGPDHRETLRCMNDLAFCLDDLGRSEEAMRLRERVSDDQVRVLGRDDLDTLTGMQNLANSYAGVGRQTDALRLREAVREGRLRALGPEHQNTLVSMVNLATSYWFTGRRNDAILLLEDAHGVYGRTVSPDHPAALTCAHNLASSYAEAGRPAEAAERYEGVLGIQRKIFPADHPELLNTQHNLAVTHETLGKPGAALELFQTVYAIRLRVNGPDHLDTLRNKWGVAVCLVEVGRSQEAIPLIDSLIPKFDHHHYLRRLIPSAIVLRLGHFQKQDDPDGCRATAEVAEQFMRTDADSLYNLACFRAVTAAEYAKHLRPTDADANARLAMAWLAKAVSAGYKDQMHMANDPDLAYLRSRSEYHFLTAKLSGRAYELAPPPRAGR